MRALQVTDKGDGRLEARCKLMQDYLGAIEALVDGALGLPYYLPELTLRVTGETFPATVQYSHVLVVA